MHHFFRFILFVFVLFTNSQLIGQSKSEILINRANEIYNKNYNASFDLCCQAEKINDFRFIGEISLCKARYYITYTDYEHAEIELTKGIRFFSQKNDLANLSAAYDLKSILLGRIGEKKESCNYLIKAYQLSKKSNDTNSQIKRLINLSHTFIDNNDLIKAEYYLTVLESLKEKFDNNSFYFLNQNRGTYHVKIHDFKKAIHFYSIALKIAEINKMIDSKATILMLLAQVYRQNNDLKNALKFASESYNFSDNNKLIYEKSEALGELIEINKELKNYEKAFILQVEFIELEKQIINTEKLNRVAAIQNRLILTEKENIINKQNQKITEEKLINKENEVKNQKLFLFIIALVIIVGFVIFIFLKTTKLNQTIKIQSKLVQTQNKDIKDSIHYAERIQQAILPPIEQFKQKFPSSFVFHRAKDILSGDFHWIEEKGDTSFLAVADCTGHGVPGALISIVNYNLLNKAVLEKNYSQPGEILDAVNQWLTESLHQTYNASNVKDGMDVSLISIDKSNNELKFAGAYNSIFIVRDQSITELKGDKFPVGMFINDIRKDFITHSYQLEKNDVIYLFTDGFADQFGGKKGKKFKYGQFKQMIFDIHLLDMDVQLQEIENRFSEWKGDLEQVDDILIIGIKI